MSTQQRSLPNQLEKANQSYVAALNASLTARLRNAAHPDERLKMIASILCYAVFISKVQELIMTTRMGCRTEEGADALDFLADAESGRLGDEPLASHPELFAGGILLPLREKYQNVIDEHCLEPGTCTMRQLDLIIAEARTSPFIGIVALYCVYAWFDNAGWRYLMGAAQRLGLDEKIRYFSANRAVDCLSVIPLALAKETHVFNFDTAVMDRVISQVNDLLRSMLHIPAAHAAAVPETPARSLDIPERALTLGMATATA